MFSDVHLMLNIFKTVIMVIHIATNITLPPIYLNATKEILFDVSNNSNKCRVVANNSKSGISVQRGYLGSSVFGFGN